MIHSNQLSVVSPVQSIFIKMLPWRIVGKKLFWSRDRLDKHEFDCLGLGLGLGLRLGL